MPQIVGGGVLILIGLLWLLERLALIDISVTAVFGLATMVTGISLMLLARDGAYGGLIVLGTILALVTLITATAPFEGFRGGIGDHTIELTTVDDLGADTTLNASVGMGDLIVRVPEGTEVSVNARVGVEELEILERVSDGIGINETYRSPGLSDHEESLVLDLDLEMFTGHVEVTDE